MLFQILENYENNDKEWMEVDQFITSGSVFRISKNRFLLKAAMFDARKRDRLKTLNVFVVLQFTCEGNIMV